MSDQIYRPLGKVPLRDEHDNPIAVSCIQCGHFALDTETQLCAACNLSKNIHTTMRVLANAALALRSGE